jgi:hypothetical protein
VNLSRAAAWRLKRLLLAGTIQADEAHVEVLAVAIAAGMAVHVVFQAIHSHNDQDGLSAESGLSADHVSVSEAQ